MDRPDPASGISRRLAGSLAVLAAAAVALLVWLCLPATVIVFNDDFGYVRSVLETLRHGRPWTDDWLEPWAASLSSLCAGTFLLTGSFRFATSGVQALLAGGIAGLLCHFWLQRRLAPPAAILWSLVVALTPALLWKTVEFGSIPLHLFCLLAAILAAERRRWVLFGLIWLVAIANRQSALVWLALPLGLLLEEAWQAGRERAPRVALRAFAVAAAGMFVLAGMHVVMNRTHAQAVMTPGWSEIHEWQTLFKHTGLALVFFLLAAGVGGFLQRVFGPDAPVAPAGGRDRWLRSAAALLVLGLFLIDLPHRVLLEHSLLEGRAGQLYAVTFALISAAGWVLGGFRLRWPWLLAALGGGLLLGLRQEIWDYYLADAVILGLCAVVPAAAPADSSASPRRGAIRLAGYGLTVFLLALAAVFLARTRQALDYYHALIQLHEPLLRAKQIAPDELSAAPFGYRGWHWYPYFVAHDGAKGGYIAHFVYYGRPGTLAVSIDAAESADPHPGQGGVLASGVFPLGWGERRRFTLSRPAAARPAALRLDPAAYSFEPFPLNDGEWREKLAPR